MLILNANNHVLPQLPFVPFRTSDSHVATTAIIDICQLDDVVIDDNSFIAICSLAAANPCTCNIFGAVDHVVATCPHLCKLMSDPVCARCLNNAIEQGHTSRGRRTANLTPPQTLFSLQARACTPPTFNWSAAMRQSNNDTGSALFTDEENSIGGTHFQGANVLALDKFVNGPPPHLQTILPMAQCQLA